MTREEMQEIAWRDFIIFAASRPKMVAAFNKATGRKYLSPERHLKLSFEEAVGKAADDARAFVDWATDNHWGLESAPKAYQKHRRERK